MNHLVLFLSQPPENNTWHTVVDAHPRPDAAHRRGPVSNALLAWRCLLPGERVPAPSRRERYLADVPGRLRPQASLQRHLQGIQLLPQLLAGFPGTRETLCTGIQTALYSFLVL